MRKGAVISKCGEYRYLLSRIWDDGMPFVGFLMLNPSTADASFDDPTIRRCIGFARQWGYGGLFVANLFAIRGADPTIIKMHSNPVGPDNDTAIIGMADSVSEVICAWGAHGSHLSRDESVCRMLAGRRLSTIKRTKDGSPGHPLYVKSTADRSPFFRKEIR